MTLIIFLAIVLFGYNLSMIDRGQFAGLLVIGIIMWVLHLSYHSYKK